jgi:hypothetical protein
MAWGMSVDGHAEALLHLLHQFGICAWMVTSSAVVGSLSDQERAGKLNAAAIITRWRIPPELVRIVVHAALGVGDVDQPQTSQAPPARLLGD